MQVSNFDDQDGFDAMRKRQLHRLLRSNGIEYPSGATKDRCIKIALGAGISPTSRGKPAVSVSEDEIAAFDLSSKKRSELLAMASKAGVKVSITMKKTEVLALLEKALDE